MKAIFEVKNKDKDGRSEGIELLYIKKRATSITNV